MMNSKSGEASRAASSSGTSPIAGSQSHSEATRVTQATEDGHHKASSPPVVPLPSNLLTGSDIFYERPPGMKARVYRSSVWEHFTSYWIRSISKVKNSESGVIEDVYVYKERAKCKYCPKGRGDFAAESGSNGTGGPNKHIPKGCKWYPGNVNLAKQKVLTSSSEKGEYNKLLCRGFDQKNTMDACVEMVVVDELPFSFVEKKGFRKFCEVGMPLFKVPSRRTLVRAFLDMYESKNKQLIKELACHRVSLTTDTWTSLQNNNYMVLTAHFIDSNWKMHKIVLNFCVITNHQGITIANLIEQCLSDWGIDKVMKVTVDNATSNKVALTHLATKLNDCPNSELLLEGKNMHMRCVARITNLIVGSGLKILNSTILAIRNAVRFVRSSPSRLEFFKKAVVREKIKFKGLVCLDVPTRWNSTYHMLGSALRLRRAFKRMEQEVDSLYLAFFNEEDDEFDEDGNVTVQRKDKKKVGPPKDADWDSCESFVTFLQVFYEVTLQVSASHHPTTHTTFHNIVHMEEVMDSFMLGTQQTPTEKLMADIAGHTKTKYNKYFGKLKYLNPFIFPGIVMDPRFKLKHVSQLLSEQLMWDDDDVKSKEFEIKNLMHELYEGYSTIVDKHLKSSSSIEPTSSINNSVKRQKVKENDGRVCSGIKYVVNWTNHVIQTDEAVIEHEIDRYLRDPVLAIRDQKAENETCTEEFIESYKSFYILKWWKNAASQYPILSSLAKDVFSIQVSTVASESSFSTGGRVIDSFRSSLTPKSVEALICMQNWLRGDEIVVEFEDEPSTAELEFYENIEIELYNEKMAVSADVDEENEDYAD